MSDGPPVFGRVWQGLRWSFSVIPNLDDTVRFLKAAAIIVAFSATAPFIYRILTKSTIVVQEVSVPPGLEARGMTGRVFSQRVIDKIIEIANYTDLLKDREDIYGLSKKNQHPDIDLPITLFGINLETLFSFLKTAAGGHDIRVVGEVVAEVASDDKIPTAYTVRFRVSKAGTIYRSAAPTPDIGLLPEQAAIGVMEEYEPITMAYYYRGKRDFENAYRMTERALLRRRPGDELWVHFVRGLIEADQGRYAAAAEEFRTVLEQSPAFPRARNNLSRVLRRGGDHEAALMEAGRALAVEPRRIQSHHNKALALRGLRRDDEALVWFKSAIDVEPHSELGHLEIANFYRQLRQFEPAIQHYRKAANLKPNSADIYTNLAGVLGDVGRWDEAEKAVVKALSISPRNGIALGYVGFIALQKRDWERARRYYTDAFGADPSYFRAHIGLARVAMQEGKLGLANEFLAKALTANAKWWDTHAARGELALLLNRENEAVEMFQAALALNPLAPSVHARLANIASGRGDQETALKHAQRAVVLAPWFFPSVAAVIQK